MNELIKNPQPMKVLTGDGGSYEYTPKTELAKLAIETSNACILEGMKPYTVDEMLRAREMERAGYDGLGELWKRSKPISTPA